ncbi:hypothetical protein Goarm_005184 [Gossypium armourianum]|uniref:Uncharacterized protein n=1 Tax=Gossypium armourianum TaxID=34283 RepID=A0A7J9JZ58_9ROSI|nr:hypothetical protein [Gossypium armourianum]
MENELASLQISAFEDDEMPIAGPSNTPKLLYDFFLVDCFVTTNVGGERRFMDVQHSSVGFPSSEYDAKQVHNGNLSFIRMRVRLDIWALLKRRKKILLSLMMRDVTDAGMEYDASVQAIGRQAVAVENVWLQKRVSGSVVSGVSSVGASDGGGWDSPFGTISGPVDLVLGLNLERVSPGGPSDALGIVTELETVPLPHGVGMKHHRVVSGPSVVSGILDSTGLIDECVWACHNFILATTKGAGSEPPLDGWGDFNEIRFLFEKRGGGQEERCMEEFKTVLADFLL